MPVIKRSSILHLKAHVDIVDVVSTVVALKRAGSKFKGLSPFNPEKTPSFFVSPDKGLYKCFSSGKAGDVISFVMETEKLGFSEAVEALSKRYNIPLEYESGGLSREERSLRQELFDLHEEAAQIYRDAFLASTAGGRFARAYWTESRKFATEVAEDFKIGLAEPDGGRLLERLQKRNFSDEALRQSGLFYVRSSGSLSPRFRGRLMIPIREQQGRIVAFTARQLEITPADDPTREAKYVNSPETPVFVKGQLLFNLDRARKNAGPGKPFLMVEGQLDAIRCWTAGLLTTVAPQGTGVTDTQLHLLHRYDAGLECFLDGDSAGQRAALRVLPLALKEGLEIQFIPLPEKVDPDALIREQGAGAVEAVRKNRLGPMRFAVSAIVPQPDTVTPQRLADACRELFAIIVQCPSAVAQAAYLAEAAELLGLRAEVLESDFRRYRAQAARRAAATPVAEAPPAPETAPADARPAEAEDEDSLACVERDLLLLLLHQEEIGDAMAQAVERQWIDRSTRAGRLLDQFLNDFAHKVWPGIREIEHHLEDPADRRFVASLLFDPPQCDDPIKVANDGIRRMVSNFCIPRKKKIDLEIAAKQRNVDADLLSLQKTSQDLERLRLKPPTLRRPV